MPSFDSDDVSVSAPVRRFETTRWSVVAAARDGAADEAREALATLCATYWYPLYAFIRGRGYDAHQAQDLTQEFFAHLLESEFLHNVDQAKGKFRSFLLACCQHFLANEQDRARAQKRGGGRSLLSFDFDLAGSRFSRASSHKLTPERLFEQRWALTLLDQVLARLRDEFRQSGKGNLFDQLKIYLTGDQNRRPYSEVSDELGLSEGTIKVAVHRLRRRFRELFREEIARTIDSPDDLDAEIRYLFTIWGS